MLRPHTQQEISEVNQLSALVFQARVKVTAALARIRELEGDLRLEELAGLCTGAEFLRRWLLEEAPRDLDPFLSRELVQLGAESDELHSQAATALERIWGQR